MVYQYLLGERVQTQTHTSHHNKRDYLKSFLNYIWLTHLIEIYEQGTTEKGEKDFRQLKQCNETMGPQMCI